MQLPPTIDGLPTNPAFVLEARRVVAGDFMKARIFPTPKGQQITLLDVPIGLPVACDREAARAVTKARLSEWIARFELVWRARG